jgi:hypothetical protein
MMQRLPRKKENICCPIVHYNNNILNSAVNGLGEEEQRGSKREGVDVNHVVGRHPGNIFCGH